MTGGFMTGGQAGTLKMTIPTAFTISMLAWSMLEFPQVALIIVALWPLSIMDAQSILNSQFLKMYCGKRG
jgi:hypothetical protein